MIAAMDSSSNPGQISEVHPRNSSKNGATTMVDDKIDEMKSKKSSIKKLTSAPPSHFDANKATEHLVRLSQEAAQAAFNRAKAQGMLTPPSAHFSQVYMIYPVPPEHSHELAQAESSSSDSDILESEKVQVLETCEPCTLPTASTSDESKNDSSLSSPEIVELPSTYRPSSAYRSQNENEGERRSFLSTPVNPDSIQSNNNSLTPSDELISNGKELLNKHYNNNDNNNNPRMVRISNEFEIMGESVIDGQNGVNSCSDDQGDQDEININNYFTPYIVPNSVQHKETSSKGSKGTLKLRKLNMDRASCPKNFCYKVALQRSRSKSLNSIWRATGHPLPLKKINIRL